MKDLLSAEDICKVFNISRTTLYRYRKDGMPYIQIKRKIMFDADEVKKWLKQFEK
ncbi:helix-turn-helix domain-containing protein [Clostridium omnivorum]|uniref:Helix-turn-helix domain-containing protein n=1 Tax=Clostridium omnivorum TaxID=1604902 RepID=A0ABQ5NCD4_9CLOT|nr:helix-turn-helix domain-containing protein [Clostridium sp. E14]GLC32881.1 hypothetical protein bsdE14_42910 [Clostridium sp. E14]